MSKKRQKTARRKKPARGSEALYVERLAHASYEALCEWFEVPEVARIGLRSYSGVSRVMVTDDGFSAASPESGEIRVSLGAAREAASEGVPLYSDLFCMTVHEVGHVFQGDHRRRLPAEVDNIEDRLEDEGRSMDEALSDAYVGVVKELSMISYGPDLAAEFPACAALKKLGVVRPVTLTEEEFSAGIIKSQDRVGCEEEESTCRAHQSGAVRASNTSVGRGLVWESLEYTDEDDDIDDGPNDEDDDGGNDDVSPVPTGPSWLADPRLEKWGRS